MSIKYLALLVSVAGLLWCGRNWQRLTHHRDINQDSARRRLEALSRSGEWMK
jgi:hypothetical protein